MAWDFDQPPLNYLKRRLTYYERKHRKVAKMVNDEFFIRKYGQQELNRLVEKRKKKIRIRVRQFKRAIKKGNY